MENLNIQSVQFLTETELDETTGGGFAYDVGFFFREVYVYATNGGSIWGSSAVITDLAINYHPAN